MDLKRAEIAVALTLLGCLISSTALAQRDNASASIKAGTVIRVQMRSYLSSRSSYAGQRFTAISSDPVYDGSDKVLPAGVEIEGHVTVVRRAGHAGRPGQVGVAIDALRIPGGNRLPINAELASFEKDPHKELSDEGKLKGEGSGKRSAVRIGTNAGLGALIGLLYGGGKGAAIGGASGAVIGSIAALASRGNEVEVRPGTVFGVKLLRDVKLPEPPRSIGPRDANMITSPALIKAAQQALANRGYDPGAIDGLMKRTTSSALREFQRDQGLPQTGVLDNQTALALRLDEVALDDTDPSASSGSPAPAHTGRTIPPAVIPPAPNPAPAASSGTVAPLGAVLTATTERKESGAIHVLIAAEPPPNGERILTNWEINGGKLEIFVRHEQARDGTQPASDGRVDVVVSERVAMVDTVVVHGANGDLILAVSRFDVPLGDRVEDQSSKMLDEYRKQLGITDKDGITVFEGNRTYRESEIELLFQIENFTNAARLYTKLAHSVKPGDGIRGGATNLVREFASLESPIASVKVNDAVRAIYQALRPDIAAIAKAYGISL